ncbi:MAG: DUF4184 family protein [Kofleriaceae bacterium]
MPFTGAHPVAVLPLLRWRRLDATCLVIGSMSPDLMYFARGELAGTFGHTPLGIALWCVPSTVLAAVLVHHVLKWPLLIVAPRSIACRAVGIVGGAWPRARWSLATKVSLVGSAVLGAITHVLWDGFTSGRGVFVHHLPALRHHLVLPVLGDQELHRFLQHVFSVIGLAVVALVILRRLRREPPIELPAIDRTRARWLFAVCFALGIALLIVRMIAMHAWSLGDLIVGPISGAMVGTLVAGGVLRHEGEQLRAAVMR